MAKKTPAPQPEVKEKIRYWVRNWKEYNRTLINRGSLTLWIADDVVERWRAPHQPKGRGQQQVYSDTAIEFMLTIRALYRFPLRQTTGFVSSLFKLMKVDLPVPDYSQVCRRQAKLKVQIRTSKNLQAKAANEGIDLIMDSTGLKVYGEGEWKVRKHGASKRRTWNKLHIGMDEQTGEIVLAILTTNGEDSGDGQQGEVALRDLLSSGTKISSFRGDGSYDTHMIYGIGMQHGIDIIVPPREDAVTLDKRYSNGQKISQLWQRDITIRSVREIGKPAWKRNSGYHKRSLVEMMFFRYKTAFGERMSARTMPNQCTEVNIRCNILNKFIQLGKPVSVPITD